MQLVDCSEQRGLMRAPASRIRTLFDPFDFVLAQARIRGYGDVVAPFVFGLTQPTGPQDHDLALARRQRRFAQDMGGKDHPSLDQPWMPRQGPRYITDLSS